MKLKASVLGILLGVAGSAYGQTDTGTGTGTPDTDPTTRAALETCKTAFDTAMAGEPKSSDWDAGPVGGALYHFHDAVWHFNVGDLADAEHVFCSLTSAWNVASITSLPQTISKTDSNGNTIELDLAAPTETFATTAGYTTKATMTFNGTQFLAMWWTGTGAATKGYLVQGQDPLAGDGNTRLKYAQWDLTTAAQSVKVYAAQFVTAGGFLSNTANGASAGGQVGVEYARGTFNTTTSEIAAHSLRIHPGQGPNAAFACQKDWFDGVVGGNVSAYHVTNTSPYSGALPVSDAKKDNTNMEGTADMTDAKTSTTGGTAQAAPSTVTFDYSCNDLDTANSATGPFANSTVSFGADPATIFPD